MFVFAQGAAAGRPDRFSFAEFKSASQALRRNHPESPPQRPYDVPQVLVHLFLGNMDGTGNLPRRPYTLRQQLHYLTPDRHIVRDRNVMGSKNR